MQRMPEPAFLLYPVQCRLLCVTMSVLSSTQSRIDNSGRQRVTAQAAQLSSCK